MRTFLIISAVGSGDAGVLAGWLATGVDVVSTSVMALVSAADRELPVPQDNTGTMTTKTANCLKDLASIK